MHKTAVLNVVGLTPALLARAPRLGAWAAGGRTARVRAVTPAVTCSAQATYLTGTLPNEHGIVGNGWYFREEREVRFWRQSGDLVQGQKLWDIARAADPSFTCANLFWWFAMYSAADLTVTPRPMYPADGRKLPDVWTHPARLRHDLQAELGTFPLFDYWGPRASIRSSRWIADAARRVEERYDPTLGLVYLPHLDYGLQKHGPDSPAIERDLLEIDAVAADLVEFYERRGARVLVLSEYGITPARRVVHPNRLLRSQGLIATREELGRELLDAGASSAFAVADPQVAHVYLNDPSKLELVRGLLEREPGVERVLDRAGQREVGLDHPRAGDLVAIAEPDAWFSYYYWVDDRRAPDFARTVDIHRKPGYDPAELFVDPAIRLPAAKAALALARKRLGFRYLMELTPLDPSLVRGTHGRPTDSPEHGPLVATADASLLGEQEIPATGVFGLILRHLGLEQAAPASQAPPVSSIGQA